MANKIIGFCILLTAGVIAFLTLNPEQMERMGNLNNVCVQLTPAEQLTNLINNDFHELAKAKQLPLEWSQVATVEYKMGSSLAKALLGSSRPLIQRIKDGTAYLEMEVLDLPDEENPGIIIQASLFDIKSKNKVFEIGRTYSMNTLNRIQDLKVLATPKSSNRTKETKIKTH